MILIFKQILLIFLKKILFVRKIESCNLFNIEYKLYQLLTIVTEDKDYQRTLKTSEEDRMF